MWCCSYCYCCAIRIAFIYGKVKADKSLQMEFMYEPAQETTDTHFELLDNENEVNLNCCAVTVST